MNQGIVFNHHSLPFRTKEEANKGLLIFVRVLQECKKSGLRILHIDDDQYKSLMSVELCRKYFVRDWYSWAQNKNDLYEFRLFLKNIITRQPLFEAVDLDKMDNGIEVGLKGEERGNNVLLAAYYFKTVLASFTAKKQWTKPNICIWVYKLGETPEETSSIVNLYDPCSISFHRQELRRRQDTLTSSVREIWSNRSTLFPNLKLDPTQIGKVLQNWSAPKDILNKAKESLFVLDDFCSRWRAGNYNSFRNDFLREMGLNSEISGESPTVRKHPKFRKDRMFYLDDGRLVYFEYHIKLPSGFRLYFYPDAKQKTIYVSYLGPHLPTKKY